MSVEILSTSAQLYAKSRFKRFAIGAWPWKSLKVEKIVKHQYVLQMALQYGELRPTSGWDLLASLRHSWKSQWVSRLASVTTRQTSTGRQPNFAALNRGHHLCLAGRPSRWALAHVPVMAALCNRGAIIFLPCSFFLLLLLWSPYVIGRPYIFCPVVSFLPSSSFIFPRLISAAVDGMSTILLHMAWP